MKKFIAYFDFLGFKDFILNNDLDYQKKIVGNILRDIEYSLAKGKSKECRNLRVADLSDSIVNCLNFSDTVVFWTNDESIESLTEIIEVAYNFNWKSVNYFFPVRGTIVHGEIFHADFRQNNEVGGSYNINSVYGKGIIDAYLKTEKQNWAGTIIDQSVVDYLKFNGRSPYDFFNDYAKKYQIPYKLGNFIQEDEFALCLVKGNLNEKSYNNLSSTIKRNFGEHSKDISSIRVQEILENTLEFLKSFKINAV